MTTPPHARTDLAHGGRWTSLRLLGREWLWHREDPARSLVAPGADFVDAGGLEECVPTVRGTPDHGAAWCRPWRTDGAAQRVDCDEFALRRRITCTADAVIASYRLTATPGYRFVWAAHALLDVSPAATLDLPDGTPVRLFPEAAGLLSAPFPKGADYVTGSWPQPCGLALHRLGPDDGTAVGAIAVGASAVGVIDSRERLTMRVCAQSETPSAIAIWRNLKGFPQPTPYRSVGVEPMLGCVFDLARAGPGDAVVVPESGYVDWSLHISARLTAP